MNTKYFTLIVGFDSLFEVHLGNGLRSLLLVVCGEKIPGNTYLKTYINLNTCLEINRGHKHLVIFSYTIVHCKYGCS